MSAPIGNNQGVNVDIPITPTTTTTTGGIGEHSVTTTSTGQTAETASTATTVATESMSQTGGAGSVTVTSSDGNVSGISVNGQPANISTTGDAKATATADKTDSASNSVLFFKEGSGPERSETLDAINEDLGGPTEASGGRKDSVSSTSSDSSLESLYGLRGTEMTDTQAAQQVGPGGLPQNAIPSYDPTSKASIIEFLKNPNVQGRMQTKGGHYVYVDEARSSFIFVKNGDWSTAESIKVTNGRTKADLTNPKTLEDCIAKFCVGFKELESSWKNVVKPGLEQKSGATGEYSHLILNMKFKTAVAYGPWNTKENSANYTPSAWRRGAELKVNKEIFGDVGGLKPISWQNTPRPTDADFNFHAETPSPQPQPQQQPFPAFQMPSINININNTNNVGGGDNTSKSSDDGIDTSNKTEETNNTEATDETNEADETDSASRTEDVVDGRIEDDGNGVDNEAPPPPLDRGSNINQNILPSTDLKTILLNVRQHLDTVYDENGQHHEGSQDLGNVVRTSENGTWVPTVRIAKGGDTTDGINENQGPDADDGGVGGVGGSENDNNEVQETGSDDSTKTKETDNNDSGRNKVIKNDDDGGELMDILDRVRKHLNEVYPGGGEEGPVEVNRNLGDVITEAEAGLEDSGTFRTGGSGNNDGFVTATVSDGPAKTAKLVNNEDAGDGFATATISDGPAKTAKLMQNEDANDGFVTATVSDGPAKTAKLVNNEDAGDGFATATISDGPAKTAKLMQNESTDNSGTGVSGKKGPPVPPKPSRTTSPQPANTATSMMSRQFGLQTNTRDLLKEVRTHLDSVYQGGRPQNVGSTLGQVVAKFRQETGSGGIQHTETVRTEIGTASTINTQGGAVKNLAKLFESPK